MGCVNVKENDEEPRKIMPKETIFYNLKGKKGKTSAKRTSQKEIVEMIDKMVEEDLESDVSRVDDDLETKLRKQQTRRQKKATVKFKEDIKDDEPAVNEIIEGQA